MGCIVIDDNNDTVITVSEDTGDKRDITIPEGGDHERVIAVPEGQATVIVNQDGNEIILNHGVSIDSGTGFITGIVTTFICIAMFFFLSATKWLKMGNIFEINQARRVPCLSTSEWIASPKPNWCVQLLLVLLPDCQSALKSPKSYFNFKMAFLKKTLCPGNLVI